MPAIGDSPGIGTFRVCLRRRGWQDSRHPLSSCFHFPSAEVLKSTPNQTMVAFEQRTPALILQLRGPAGGAGDIGEEQRGEYSFCSGLGTRAGRELLDLVGHIRPSGRGNRGSAHHPTASPGGSTTRG